MIGVSTTTLLPAPFAWCAVPAGTITLAHGLGPYDVPAFEIARYPITHVQYEVFALAEDGYANPAWWDFSPQAQRWRAGHPDVEESQFPAAEMPRTSVSWYEAVAFTRWLSAREGEAVRLPTEQEWQRAAQGDDDRAFPWGGSWEVDRCNSSESGIKQPTSVLAYPNGASPYGVLDMSGNIAEWCLNSYHSADDPDGADAISLIGSQKRAVRGGSWGLSHHSARVDFVSFNHAEDRFSYQGFRVVRQAGGA